MTKSGPATVSLGQDVTYTIIVRNAGPGTATGVLFIDDFTATAQGLLASGDGSCSFGAARVICALGNIAQGGATNTQIALRPTQRGPLVNSVTVTGAEFDPNPGNNSASITTNVTLRTDDGEALVLSYTTELKVAGAEITRGRVIVNDSILIPVDSSSPRTLQSRARPGQNQFEAAIESELTADGTWRFDFSRSRHFIPASLRVQSGEVLSQDSHTVVFAVRKGGPPLRFTLELDPAELGQRE